MKTSEASFLPCSKHLFSLIFKNYYFESKELWILASLSLSLNCYLQQVKMLGRYVYFLYIMKLHKNNQIYIHFLRKSRSLTTPSIDKNRVMEIPILYQWGYKFCKLNLQELSCFRISRACLAILPLGFAIAAYSGVFCLFFFSHC